MADNTRFSIQGNSIRFHTTFQGQEGDFEMGSINTNDDVPELPRDVDGINEQAIVLMGCPKLDVLPVSMEDLDACRAWLDTQGYVHVRRLDFVDPGYAEEDPGDGRPDRMYGP